ncbi:hypothetical protein [Flavihumibacter sp. UBA7668]|uniref:Cap15 family cyclic dinucleotide receptor domain-containing protein n=1 Tax=Flavihumibacter sp. UBA7668 TaxID=1946542 RepID=UPI0025BB3CBA|nr:hypothetical protein [Flavihumibacter sp. UBA7668]
MNFKYFNIGALIAFVIILSIPFGQFSAWLENVLQPYPAAAQIYNYINPLSTLGLISLTLVFVNKIGWKWGMFKWLVDVPNLNGRYEGILISSYNSEQKDCVLEIKQTASYIHIFAYFGNLGSNDKTSKSVSVSEEIVQEKNGLYKLFYIFSNESDTLQIQLNNHEGTSKLYYYPDVKRLEGDYYNQRGNTGTLNVVFKQEKLLGRFQK